MAVFQAKPSQKPHKNFYAYYRKDLTRIRYKRRKPPAVTICGENFAPKKFTGKEQDQETGLYYFGARYLDPKTSRWLSGDPALGDYLPVAPNGDDAKKHNQNLPGMGGVFNVINLHVYHYAGNNPVKYIDPDGRWVPNDDGTYTAEQGDTLWDLYGADWQEKSGYIGDPTKLQVGDIVGKLTERTETVLLPNQNSNTKNITIGIGAKAAIVFGIGLEGGVEIDTDGGIGLYGTLSFGVGVELGLSGEGGKLVNFVKAMVGPSAGWFNGSVQTGLSKTTTVDAGVFVMGSWDMNNLGTNGLPTNGVSFGAVGGGVWRNYKGTIKIK